jgi:tripartite motif-containing protein 2/3/tripartite motif-containing protein 71
MKSTANGVAVNRDGSTLVVSDHFGDTHSVSMYNVVDGLRQRVIGGPAAGAGPLHFNRPTQVWITGDDHVFVADWGNHRVQVLTPGAAGGNYAASSTLGVGELSSPSGVCANADIVVVSEVSRYRITVLKRSDGTIIRRMGSQGSGDGQLSSPQGLCFMSLDTNVAVADNTNDRVSVFGVDGTFARHVGVGVLKSPLGVACSAFDELVVADAGNRCVRLFSVSGELLKSFAEGSQISGVAIHGGIVFAHDTHGEKCLVFT